MLNLSLRELKLIVENRGIKGYKSIPKDRLSSALIALQSVEKREKIF